MSVRTMALCTVVALAAVTAGCSHYYKVNDPAGSKEYYTTKVDESVGGAIKIKDEKTGATVTLQSSEVKEISEEEFEKAVKEPKPKP